MDKQDFDALCDRVLFKPLLEDGLFQRKGQSIFKIEDDILVSLIRLGGRKSSPGSISHVLCIKCLCMPNLNEKVTATYDSNVFSYPFKLKPMDLLKPEITIQYKPSNLRYDHECYSYHNKTSEEVEKYLLNVLVALDVVRGWTHNLSYQMLIEQIETYGEQAWIENLWLDSLKSQ